MFLGAWKTARAPRDRADYFVVLETTPWSFGGDPLYVPVVKAAAVVTAAWLVPGLAVRPGRSGLADDASEERTGLALLELMLF